MPGDERCREGLRIAGRAGAGHRCQQGLFQTWTEGNQAGTMAGPRQHPERQSGEKTRSGRTQSQIVLVTVRAVQ
jgi:hypothetical protein